MQFILILISLDGAHEPSTLIGSMSNINQTGYMDTHGQPSTEAVYALPHYYTSQNPAAAAASESWKNHQEQYSSPFPSALTNKEEFSRDVDNRYHHTSIGGQPITVPQSSSSPYNQESQSLHLFYRSSSVANDDIGEGTRGATPYDCY